MAFPDISSHVVWASTGEVIDPGDTKTAQGWIVEAPPYQYYNWWQNRVDEALVVLGSQIDQFDAEALSFASPGATIQNGSSALLVWGAGTKQVGGTDSVVIGSWSGPGGFNALNLTDSFLVDSSCYNDSTSNRSNLFMSRATGPDPADGVTTGAIWDSTFLHSSFWEGASADDVFAVGGYFARADIDFSTFLQADADVWDYAQPRVSINDSFASVTYLSNLSSVDASFFFGGYIEGVNGSSFDNSVIFSHSFDSVIMPLGGQIADTFSFQSPEALQENTEGNVFFHAGDATSVPGNRNFVHHIDTTGGLTVSGDLNTVFSSDSTLEDMRVAGDSNVFGAHSGWRHSQVGVEGFIDADQCVILGGRSSVEVDADANNSIALGVTTFKAVATGGPTGPVFAAVSTTAEFENSSNSAILASRISKVTDGLQSVVVGSSYVENNVPNSLAMGYNGSPTTASPNNITIHLFAETGNAEFSGNVTSGAGGNEVVMDAGFMDFTPLIEADRPAHTEGRVYYDAESKSLVYNTDINDVTVNLGRELQTPVRNVSGATIPNGSVVFATGSSGERITVDLAQADAFATSRIIAVATHSIGDQSNGYTTTFGRVRGLDTSAWPAGTTLYLSSTTPGAFTDTPPAEPAYTVKVATVERSHATIGRILVAIDHQSVDASQVIGNALTDDNVLDDYGIRAPLSVKPTLSLNFAENEYEVYEGVSNGFTKKPVADILDIVRSTVETGVTATGLIEESAANELPLVFDPETGRSLGAQVASEHTNLFLWSEDFSQTEWVKSEVSIAVNSVESPDGGVTADTVTESSASAPHYVSQSFTYTAGLKYTVSIFAKAKERSALAVTFPSGLLNNFSDARIDLTDGSLISASGEISPSDVLISPLRGGWVRIEVSVTADNSGSSSSAVQIRLYDGSSSNYTGDGVSGVYLWGAQVTESGVGVPYVKTENTQVTKSDTLVERTVGAELPSPEGSTILIDLIPYSTESGPVYGGLADTFDDTVYLAPATGVTIRSGGGVSLGASVPFAVGERARVAIRLETGNLKVYSGGQSRGESTNAAPETFTQLRLGRSPWGTGNRSRVMFAEFNVIPRALSDAEMIAWTTPRSTP